MSEIINIKKSDLIDIYTDSVRFCSHIFVLHTLGFIALDENNLFSMKLFKTLLFTILSITIYHLIIKKIVYGKNKI